MEYNIDSETLIPTAPLSRLKRRQVVMVYEDPITCQKPEGRARLYEFQREDTGDGLEMWVVTFLDDGYQATRTINKEHLK